MARRRNRTDSSRTIWIGGCIAVLAGVWGYGRFVSPVLEGRGKSPAETQLAAAPSPSPTAAHPAPAGPRLTSQRPEVPTASAPSNVPEKGADEPREPSVPADPQEAERANQLFAAGMQASTQGELVVARANLSDAVNLGLPPDRLLEARALLTRLGAETVFSPRVVDGDPLVARYVVQPGEALGEIARRLSVTDDFLATINSLADKNRLRAGQTIKIVQGPFHVSIDKKNFSLDVYLQTTFVKHFSVGLGADGSTPRGEWLVTDKLTNPTYFPPRGGQIIAADDPENPLGEYWIGLRGQAGEAIGQERYGIHGTTDPDSIGKNMSMGCVRMHNEDVAELFNLLVTGKSRVTVR